ncbi:MAG: UDP-N-acetylmuramate:L-alanyl-gamma-D-glutamyl-meso-diaminopimelate ligase [Candidatus Accumulibacter sp.]|jgi:UDP-N-acetylmuramate: L-alanyl-gamma-D-glutamyl-meso-diaminopimelate ligase|nr:UDP-N-acetylmuramate:L-alanyl-gamma-D-glutamyl-meso-diaminopimelate ligase [Accumulibacter sp.]
MHIHILGICGTFMGGIAQLARAAGHRVTGCDSDVYPPMSDQLNAAGIDLVEGYAPDQTGFRPDFFIVGNAISRGNPLLEEILDKNLPYLSGPQWLADHVLRGRHVMAVAGTHGKTTTTSMLAWILEHAGLNPGFLIGGVPIDFGVSARLSGKSSKFSKSFDSPCFVIEADEYDTAFCDKRSKFIHYRPQTTIMNNLEFDHADIFPDLAAIEAQFHHLVRTLPRTGLIVSNAAEEGLERVLARGCWTPVERFNDRQGWHVEGEDIDGSIRLMYGGKLLGETHWTLCGDHNRANAAAALLAARRAGAPFDAGLDALSRFRNVKRRMELRGTARGISVFDDFAHHPTAIATTLAGFRRQIGHGSTNTPPPRLLAVLEPRSNTMKLGVMKNLLPGSLADADQVFCYAPHLSWDITAALAPLGNRAIVVDDIDELVGKIAAFAQRGDQILVMSNGGFGGIHEKLLTALEQSP